MNKLIDINVTKNIKGFYNFFLQGQDKFVLINPNITTKDFDTVILIYLKDKLIGARFSVHFFTEESATAEFKKLCQKN